MKLIVGDDEYKVPHYLTIEKWCELQKWSLENVNNHDKLISILMGVDILKVMTFPEEIKQTAIFILSSILFHKEKSNFGELRNFNEFNIGQFIDMEVYIAGGIHNYIEEIVELIWEGVEYDPEFPAHEVYDGIQKYFNFRKTIFNKYKSFFGFDENKKNDTTMTHIDVARTWYQLLLILANGEFLKMNEASEQPLISSLNFLSYDKDKKTEEFNRLKKIKK